MPKPTAMSVKRLLGILCDVLLKADTFIFPGDFIILGCEVDFKVPIILGRPFLATARALVDIERGDLKFRLNLEEVKFNICRSMKKPREMEVVSAIKVVTDDGLRAPIKERIDVETLVIVLMNFDVDLRSDYVETINVVQVIGAHSYAPKKLNFDFKIRPKPLAKPSIKKTTTFGAETVAQSPQVCIFSYKQHFNYDIGFRFK